MPDTNERTIYASCSVSTQETGSLFSDTEPVVPSPILEFETDDATHDPAEREDGETESAIVYESRTFWGLLDDESEEVPCDG